MAVVAFSDERLQGFAPASSVNQPLVHKAAAREAADFASKSLQQHRSVSQYHLGNCRPV